MGGIAALGVAYVLSQFYRSFMAVLTPALTLELGASKAELSLASGAWFAAFALLQFVVGVCLDIYGPKLTVAIMLALCGGGGALVFSVATAPWMIVVAMALLGAGCAPVLMAAMFIFAHSYPPARLAVMTSWLIAFGSAGNGTTSHLAGEIYKSSAGVSAVHIPYRGGAQIYPELMSGRLDLLMDTPLSGMPFVKDGKLALIAVGGTKRTPLAPDVPTFLEQGISDFDPYGWTSIFAPAKLPPPVLAPSPRARSWSPSSAPRWLGGERCRAPARSSAWVTTATSSRPT